MKWPDEGDGVSQGAAIKVLSWEMEQGSGQEVYNRYRRE